MALTALSKIASNTSTTFQANLLRASANLFNLSFKTTPAFDGDHPELALPCPSLKTPVVSTIVKMVLKGTISIDTIVITCSRIRYTFLLFFPEKYLY